MFVQKCSKVNFIFCLLGPLKEDQTVMGYILSLPRKCVRGLVNRAALFVWWTGAWVNEGENMQTKSCDAVCLHRFVPAT